MTRAHRMAERTSACKLGSGKPMTRREPIVRASEHKFVSRKASNLGEHRMAGGMSLAEMLVCLFIFGIVLSLAVGLFASAQHLYSGGAVQGGFIQGGAVQVDVQTDAELALPRLTREVQESNLAGTQINATHTAVLLISARNSQGAMQFYNGATAGYLSQPNWQKWVVYYLNPALGNPYTKLVRKEGIPAGMPALPNDPPAIPAIPAGWETLFRNSNLSQLQVSPDIQTFTVQDINCGVSGNPLYAQIITAKVYAGAVSNFNPGIAVPFTCGGQSGNWVGLYVKN